MLQLAQNKIAVVDKIGWAFRTKKNGLVLLLARNLQK